MKEYRSAKISCLSRVVLVACSAMLVIVLFVPMWQIQMDAPQYPEGLVLKMYPNKLAGNVDIINGLNHYIGMKTLHSDDFVEFTVLPYIIIFFALLCVIVGVFLNNKRWLLTLFFLLLLFGVIAMADFWRWEYNYGHDLSDDAAIKVPGTAYQPPLIGYKKLLNFGVYSIPDTGGWLFIAVGILLLAAVFVEFKARKMPSFHNKSSFSVLFLFSSLLACSTGPQKIIIGKDACSFCKMSIIDQRFGAEILTKKGKVYKFDDLHCLFGFMKDKTVADSNIDRVYVVDFESPHDFITAGSALFLRSEELHSPMNSNIASFRDRGKQKLASERFKGEVLNWEQLLKEK